MEVVYGLLLLAAVALFVSRPLRRAAAAGAEDPAIADLEARKEARYREIQDARLDRAAGKLSAEEHARIDAELRTEAAAILRELERLRADGG